MQYKFTSPYTYRAEVGNCIRTDGGGSVEDTDYKVIADANTEESCKRECDEDITCIAI